MANAKKTAKKSSSKTTTEKRSTKKPTQTPEGTPLRYDPIEAHESKHDLDRLAEETEHPGALFREVVLGGRSESELVELGQSFATEDILCSVPRFVSAIAEQRISPQQRAILFGYSPEKVALLVHETRRLRAMSHGFEQRSANNNAVARRNQLRHAMGEGVTLRDSVLRLLDEVVPPGTAERSALGNAETPSNLARTLRALARIAKTVRAQASAPARAIYDGLGLTDRLADDLIQGADAIDASEKLVLGSTGTRLSQRELDYQDGIVLALVGSLWRAFAEAHERLPTLVIPPLGRLARLVGKRRAQPIEPATPEPTS